VFAPLRVDLTAFRTRVATFRRAAGRSQAELAEALGLHPSVLSHKLHAAERMLLHDEVTGIVRTLAAWRGITSRAQAVELLVLMDLPASAFSAADWSRPPLATLDSAPAQPNASTDPQPSALRPRHAALPADLTPLVGRDREVEIVVELLADQARLLTLTGVGGTGKTRLALQAARVFAHRTADEVWFVDLAPTSDSEQVPATVAAALAVPDSGPGLAEDRLLVRLRERPTLLVLDNFEQVLGAGLWVANLLRAAPALRVLATSRVPLRVSGEHEFHVPPLGLPTAAASEKEVLASEAVQLFVQRARATRADIDLTGAHTAVLGQICARLDGLPLAIELAAARVRQLPLDVLLARLDRRLEVLDRGPHDLPVRQRTLRATLDWSFALLPADLQRLFASLGVFVGGCTAAAVQAVCPDAAERVEDGLWKLVDAALLESVDQLVHPLREPRFRMLETVREYALAQVVQTDSTELAGLLPSDGSRLPTERDALEARHSAFYLAFVAERERAIVRGEPPQAAVELRAELDNIRQAWAWATAHAAVEAVSQAAYCLALFYYHSGLLFEAERAFALAVAGFEVVSLDGADPATQRARASLLSSMLASQSQFLAFRGVYDQALTIAQRAVAIDEANGSTDGAMAACMAWGEVVFRAGDYAAAHHRFEQALHLARTRPANLAGAERAHDVEWRACLFLGLNALTQDDYAAASGYAEEGLRLCQDLGRLRGQLTALTIRARVSRRLLDLPAARQDNEAVLRLSRALAHPWGEAVGLLRLGEVACLEGQYDEAWRQVSAALGLFREIGDRQYQADALAALGRVADILGDTHQARERLDQALGLLAEVRARDVEVATLTWLARHYVRLGDAQIALDYGDRAVGLADRTGSRWQRVQALVTRGHTLASLDRLEDACAAYAAACARGEELTHALLATEARAGLAAMALAQGDRELALVHVAKVLEVLGAHPRAGLDDPFGVYVTCSEVLEANHDPRAVAVLAAGQRLMRHDAELIADLDRRHTFVQATAPRRALQPAQAAPVLSYR